MLSKWIGPFNGGRTFGSRTAACASEDLLMNENHRGAWMAPGEYDGSAAISTNRSFAEWVRVRAAP
jgi:hypothetical protein